MMRRQVLAAACGLALLVGGSLPTIAQAKTHSDSIFYHSPVAALKGYLSLMNSGDMARAYSIYADIHRHILLNSWRSQGDLFKGTHPVLTQAHVTQKDGIATVYSVISEQHPMPHTKMEQIYLFSLIEQRGNWKLAYSNSSFGIQKYKVFEQLDREQQQYALKQLRK